MHRLVPPINVCKETYVNDQFENSNYRGVKLYVHVLLVQYFGFLQVGNLKQKQFNDDSSLCQTASSTFLSSVNTVSSGNNELCNM